ncbi:MAG: TonB-dependent receptor [Saprospiraceae bacterium]|nr:TonB-dependent receptor [Saprospiraceae bacterium]
MILDKLFLTLWIWMMAMVCVLDAQDGWLRGLVLGDRQDPLVSATVKIGESGTLTDLDGTFLISMNLGSYILEIRYLGYISYRDTIDILAGDTLYLEINLQPQQNLLGEVTVTTGKYEKPIGETTISIEIVKPQLLEHTNTTSIDEVLDKVPGVTIIDGQANIRGGSGFSYGAGSRVLLLVDDIPAMQADAGFPNWDDFPVENLAQMEVVKGASSALYGSAALNGIINIRTAYATEEPITKISTFYTGFMTPKDKAKKWWDRTPRTFGLSVSDSRRIGKFDLVHGLYWLDRNSYERSNFDDYGRINSKIRYRPKHNLEIGLLTNVNRNKQQNFFFWRDHESGAYQSDSTNLSISNGLRFTVDPYLKIVTDNGDRHEVKGRMFYVDNKNNSNRSNRSDLYYGEYQYLKRFKEWNALTTVGLMTTHTRVNAPLYGDTTFATTNVASYLQMEKKFFEKLIIQGGIRYERNILTGPETGSQAVPGGKLRESKPVFRAGLNYQPFDYTYVRASWGQGYRYPTIAERFITTDFGTLFVSPNPSLESETGWSSEIGIRQGFKVIDFRGFADLAFYWSEYQDMMEFVFTGLIKGFQSQNIGDTRIRGIDLSINGGGNIFGFESTITAGYTFIDPRFQEFSEQDSLASSADFNILKYRSKHLLKLDFQTGYRRVDLGFSIQHTSNMVAIDKIFELAIPGVMSFRETHKSYTVTDVRFKYSFSQTLSLAALLNNALNAEYSVRPGLLAAPRSITVRLQIVL